MGWGEGGRKSEGSIEGAKLENQEHHGPPPEQQQKMIRQCPLTIAQQLVYDAVAVPTEPPITPFYTCRPRWSPSSAAPWQQLRASWERSDSAPSSRRARTRTPLCRSLCWTRWGWQRTPPRCPSRSEGDWLVFSLSLSQWCSHEIRQPVV